MQAERDRAPVHKVQTGFLRVSGLQTGAIDKKDNLASLQSVTQIYDSIFSLLHLQCTCPPTATCNEETGDCICAPNVTGEPGNECSRCEENTFGYDSITGCQECACQVEGTVAGNMSCSLETGQCYCKDNVEGRTCDHCSAGAFNYPECETCPCDLRGTTEDICDQGSDSIDILDLG